jgi:hypothetical protein
MTSKLVKLGTLSFRVETSEPVDPKSARAQELARSLAQSLNATFKKKIPAYAVKSKVLEVRAGSIVAVLQLYADIVAVGGAAVALGKFAKDYPSIRAGVLQIARDVKSVATTAWGSIGAISAVLEGENLLTGEQIDKLAKAARRKTLLTNDTPGGPIRG